MLTFFSGDVALEYTSSSPTNFVKSVAASPTTTDSVKAVATNIILQSKDGGQTWQDISHSLPENEQPEGFFAGESDLYLHGKNEMYRSKSNLKTPVWEKETEKNWKQVQKDLEGNVVESEGVFMATGTKGIMRSTDNGEHWEYVISEGGVGIAIERIDGGFAAITYNTSTKSRRIRISSDSGKTWKAIDEGLQPSLSISSIKQMGKYLICGHPDGIFRSSDMGKTWNIVHSSVDKIYVKAGNSVASSDNRNVFKIFVSGNVLYAVARNSGC